MAKKKKKTAGQDAENREYRIKEQIEMDKLSANHQFHNVTSQTATKTTLKPEAQKFMVRYGTSKDFGEDEKHKILLYFSLLILLIRCRGRWENAKAKWAADICLWLISAADNQRWNQENKSDI